MTDQNRPAYPDITDLLARKAKGREEIAKLSFDEKIAVVEALRERLAPFRTTRVQRKPAQEKNP